MNDAEYTDGGGEEQLQFASTKGIELLKIGALLASGFAQGQDVF
jgi:hypothetical protein